MINNNNKYAAIYVRRSVSDKDKGNNSLSIISQEEKCINYLKNEGNKKYKVYRDDGKSGKDIKHRPAFSEMLADANDGLIDVIVCVKIDRFTRSNRDFYNVIADLEENGVDLVFVENNVDTRTPAGRFALSVMVAMAQIERENISERVADAYSTKARETGFYQGGKVYFGYQSSRQTVNGKTGSVLIPSVHAYAVQKAYEIYQKPEAGLTDVMRYFQENNVDTFVEYKDGTISNMGRSHISRILESPLYVRADKDVYNFFVSKGVEMLDDVSAYDGVHGLYLHGKFHNKNGNTPVFVKVGYHEGLVDSEIWLAVQDKKTHTSKFKGKKKVVSSWLSGMIKCAHCGYALTVSYRYNFDNTKVWRNFKDSGYFNRKGCVKSTLRIRPDDVEAAVFEAMKERLSSLDIARKEREKPNPEVQRLEDEIIRNDTEIKSLIDKVALANDTLMKHINDRIKILDNQKEELEQKLNKLKRKQKAVDTEPLAEPLARWNELTVQEKRNLAGKIIDVIRVSDETGIEITFSI